LRHHWSVAQPKEITPPRRQYGVREWWPTLTTRCVVPWPGVKEDRFDYDPRVRDKEMHDEKQPASAVRPAQSKRASNPERIYNRTSLTGMADRSVLSRASSRNTSFTGYSLRNSPSRISRDWLVYGWPKKIVRKRCSSCLIRPGRVMLSLRGRPRMFW